MARKLAAGNWKMNGDLASLAELDILGARAPIPGCDVVICPPATLIAAAADRVAGGAIGIGGQDCHAATNGAHTGDLSAQMLREAGAQFVILGHSERRADHGETSAAVCAKLRAARAAGLTPIVCAGENLEERQAGDAVAIVVEEALSSLPDEIDADVVVAYEPIWAIGTGEVATVADIAEMHGALRAALVDRFGPELGAAIRLLYGGSVKPGNAAEIFAVPEVNGALVGGASLKASDFAQIIDALAQA